MTYQARFIGGPLDGQVQEVGQAISVDHYIQDVAVHYYDHACRAGSHLVYSLREGFAPAKILTDQRDQPRCPECDGSQLVWDLAQISAPNAGPANGAPLASDVIPVLVLGCAQCSATIRTAYTAQEAGL